MKDLAQKNPVAPGGLVAVVGAGVSGTAVCRLLSALGVRVRLLDKDCRAVDRTLAALIEQAGGEVLEGEHRVEHFRGINLAVISPGVPLTRILPLLEAAGSVPFMSELEFALHFVDAPVLAVTGTSGKTTTVSLAAAMLRRAGKEVFLGGNIGVPLSQRVLEEKKTDVLVLELSSFQLQGTVSLHPHAAVLLNLAPNHLDHHQDMQEYTEAKLNLFRRQDANDIAVLPPELAPLYAQHGFKARVVPLVVSGRFEDMRLLGMHNRLNAEAAFLACSAFGISEAEAVRAAKEFAPLRHRLEPVGEQAGVRYVNDSKSTTVDALRVALEALPGPVILLAGGKFKGGDLSSLRALLQEKTRSVALYGGSREVFEEAWKGTVPLTWHATMDGAFAGARAAACAGDVVLLSPATSSYDQYVDYQARGDHFCALAKGEA